MFGAGNETARRRALARRRRDGVRGDVERWQRPLWRRATRRRRRRARSAGTEGARGAGLGHRAARGVVLRRRRAEGRADTRSAGSPTSPPSSSRPGPPGSRTDRSWSGRRAARWTAGAAGQAVPATRLQDGDIGHRFPSRVDAAAGYIWPNGRTGGAWCVWSAAPSATWRTPTVTPSPPPAGCSTRAAARCWRNASAMTAQSTGRVASAGGGVGVSATGRTRRPRLRASRSSDPARHQQHRLQWFDRTRPARGSASEPGDYWQVRLSPDDDRPRSRCSSRCCARWTSTCCGGIWRAGARDAGPCGGHRPGVVARRRHAALSIPPQWAGEALHAPRRRAGAPETLVEDSPGSEVPSEWTAAGEMLFSAASDTRPDTDVFRRAPGGAVAPALADGFNQSDARISPDGGLVAYVSDESGQRRCTSRPGRHEGAAKTAARRETAPRPAQPRPRRHARASVRRAARARDGRAGRCISCAATARILRADRLTADDSAYAVPVRVLAVPGLRDFDTAHRSARILAVVPETSTRPAAVDALVDWTSALAVPK